MFNRYERFGSRIPIVLLVTLSLFSCDSNVQPDASRISERGMDGFEFGVTMQEIRDSLGEPTGFLSISGGLVGFEGPTYGDSLAFLTLSRHSDSASVDAFIGRGSYSGTTKDNLGIGSHVDELSNALGSPLVIHQESFYIYCMGSRYLQFAISEDDGRVVNIFFGEEVPGTISENCS